MSGAGEARGSGSALSFSVATRVEELDRINEEVDGLAKREGLSPEFVYPIKLALEEVLMNVINHGHPDRGEHRVDVSLTLTDEAITVDIADDGRPFDPLTEAPRPDIDASVEDRRIGGLGVYLIREMMDEVRYRRERGRNRLVLAKRRNG